MQEVESRQQIMSHVQQGQIDEAVELTDRLAPGLLQQEPQLDFRLRCQKFIELVWLHLYAAWAASWCCCPTAAQDMQHLAAGCD